MYTPIARMDNLIIYKSQLHRCFGLRLWPPKSCHFGQDLANNFLLGLGTSMPSLSHGFICGKNTSAVM